MFKDQSQNGGKGEVVRGSETILIRVFGVFADTKVMLEILPSEKKKKKV